MTNIPENITDFLYWVKDTTEEFWAQDLSEANEILNSNSWICGAKWIGLSDEEIIEIEKKYAITFTPEHREFLRILHTIDRKQKITYQNSFEKDAKPIVKEVSFFYNWLEDDIEIKAKMNWPEETILKDVLGVNRVWLKSWGARPASDLEKTKIVIDWIAKAPKLIPVIGHRFIVSDLDLKQRPILSVYGSDIVVYGWNFRSYILNDLQEHLNLQQIMYDEEDGTWYGELKEEIQEIFNKDYYAPQNDISYWKEMILLWNSGWSSFGLDAPSEDNSIVQPIRKTYCVEDDENDQKKFGAF